MLIRKVRMIAEAIDELDALRQRGDRHRMLIRVAHLPDRPLDKTGASRGATRFWARSVVTGWRW